MSDDVLTELEEAKARIAQLEAQLALAVRTFLRLQSAGVHVLTNAERNLICGLPADWKRLSDR